MAYNNGFPINYHQMYPQYNYIPQQPIIQTQPVTNDNGIIWVQGEAGAKSWAVAPGKSVMLSLQGMWQFRQVEQLLPLQLLS